MKDKEVKKLVMAAMFVALAVALSPLSIQVGTAKCFPVQHLVNVMTSFLLGPLYSVGAAFTTSLIRVLLGTGTLLAFPGSMAGALLAGLAYLYTKKLWAACVGETIGTGVIGALLAYPVAALLMGKEVSLFTFFIPFLISTVGGSIIAFVMLSSIKKLGIMEALDS
ncbi:MAG: energy coupling factor transporter S component ThiW [Bacillota bacterium]|nr:energy coupling factor transporter S component ThiW [Bacillota bacterium]